MEPLYTTGWNVNQHSHYGKQYRDSTKKIKIDIPYDAATLFLGVYLKEIKSLSQRDIFTLMFSTALFTIAKIGK